MSLRHTQNMSYSGELEIVQIPPTCTHTADSNWETQGPGVHPLRARGSPEGQRVHQCVQAMSPPSYLKGGGRGAPLMNQMVYMGSKYPACIPVPWVFQHHPALGHSLLGTQEKTSATSTSLPQITRKAGECALLSLCPNPPLLDKHLAVETWRRQSRVAKQQSESTVLKKCPETAAYT